MSLRLALSARAGAGGPSRRDGLLAAVAIALLIAAGASPARAATQPVAWPTLRLVDGSTVAPEHWRGRPAVVVFWATWCGFCERHNARIERLFRSLDGRGPRIIGVSIDGNARSVGRLVRERGWTFPVTLDEGSLRRQFTPWRIVPMTCLLDAQGIVRQCIPGEMSEDDVMGLARLPAT